MRLGELQKEISVIKKKLVQNFCKNLTFLSLIHANVDEKLPF